MLTTIDQNEQQPDEGYRPANGGNAIDQMRPAIGGNIPAAGPHTALAARSPVAPMISGGAYAMPSKPNAGGPSVQEQVSGGFYGNYTGRGENAGPRPARVMSRSAQISTPVQGAALESFLSEHPKQQGGQQGPQQSSGPQQGPAEEAPEAAEGAEAAGAGAAEGAGAASTVELLGLL